MEEKEQNLTLPQNTTPPMGTTVIFFNVRCGRGWRFLRAHEKMMLQTAASHCACFPHTVLIVANLWWAITKSKYVRALS